MSGGSGSRLHNTRSSSGSLVSSRGSSSSMSGGSLGKRIGDHRRLGRPNTGGSLASYNAVVAGHLQSPCGESNHLDTG